MVANLAEYPWSSHRAYLGFELLPWLTTDLVLAQFHGDLSPARKAYAAFMAEGAREEYRGEFHSGSHEGRILGDDRFADEVLAQFEGAPCKPINGDRLKGAVMEEFCCTMADLETRSQRQHLAQARAVLGWLTVQTGAVSLTEAGRWVGRDMVTMSAAVRRLVDRAERVAEVKRLMERLLHKVSRQEALSLR